jgi:hypothetical protein
MPFRFKRLSRLNENGNPNLSVMSLYRDAHSISERGRDQILDDSNRYSQSKTSFDFQ